MNFFFVRDYLHKYRCFTAEPVREISVKFSRFKRIWELAKAKLMLLPQRILRQEQAFTRALKLQEKKIQIYHSGCLEEKRIKTKFYFFLHKQRTKHILLLIGETLLLPISGLAALIPGPNVFFGALALLMITHWQALRGINRILRKKQDFIPAPLFASWEKAAELKEEKDFPQILKEIEKEYHLDSLNKILWK